jgi:hypothetical protein
MKKAHEHSHHGHTGSPGIPYAMVLTVSFVLSPVRRCAMNGSDKPGDHLFGGAQEGPQ